MKVKFLSDKMSFNITYLTVGSSTYGRRSRYCSLFDDFRGYHRKSESFVHSQDALSHMQGWALIKKIAGGQVSRPNRS